MYIFLDTADKSSGFVFITAFGFLRQKSVLLMTTLGLSFYSITRSIFCGAHTHPSENFRGILFLSWPGNSPIFIHEISPLPFRSRL